MDKTENMRMISRFWLPRKIREKKYAEFQLDISKLFSTNPLTLEIQKLWLYNKLTLLRAVYTSLTINGGEHALKYYQENYGEFKTAKDLEILGRDITRLQSKYKEIEMEAEKSKGNSENKQSFETVISGVELLLERSLSRDLTMYEFKSQYDIALKKSKQNTKSENG